ncbi:hypothetical protein B0O99DRAFT_601232 [Bisporella sp. PMI_857]|nr:hypothetical protein B0O99DRAFT_601232 [Bisporella sp. PMI_857]
MKEELRNQIFAFEALEKSQPEERKDIRIPEVYRVIERKGRIYIVMEYAEGTTLVKYRDKGSLALEIQNYYKQIAKAIRLFLAFDIPDESSLEPVGGEFIRHPTFKDSIASIRSNSVQVANCPNNNFLMIDFTGEKMCFCFSDLFEGNFIFTPTNTLYIADFHHAAFLPPSFMARALDQPRPVCAAIKEQFSLPQKNLSAMRVAGYYFGISTRRVGLEISREKSKSRIERRGARYATATRRVIPGPGPGPGPRVGSKPLADIKFHDIKA